MKLESSQGIHILHVDDEPEVTDLTGTFLEREDDRFTVETATSADEGLQRIDDRPPDCVVSDYNMPGMDGTGFGLRIVEQVADAHRWKIAVTESEQGGARFEITGIEFADR